MDKLLRDYLFRLPNRRGQIVTRSGTSYVPAYKKSGRVVIGTFTPGFGYHALTPANLTGEKGILISQSDNLQYTRGSKTQNNESVVYENFNPNQGTLEFWVRPNWDGDDGEGHYIVDIANSADTNRMVFYKSSAGVLRLLFRDKDDDDHIVQYDVSSVWTAGNEYHVVVTWDLNAPSMALYTAGTLRDNTYAGTINSGDVDALPSNFQIGENYAEYSQFDGTIAGRILNRPLTSAEVTALYNGGDGTTESFSVTPDTVWMGTYSDDDTDAVFQHRGQEITSSQAAVVDAVTIAEAAGSRSWTDNDRVVVYDGTGYKVEGLLAGTPATTDTTLDVDDGAAGAVTDIEKVGVSLDFNATYYAAGGDVHDVDLNDLGIAASVRIDSNASGSMMLLEKKDAFNEGWTFYIDGSGKVNLVIEDSAGDGSDSYAVIGATDIRDNKWHHIAAIIDRDNAANCKVFLDGYEDGTTKVGTVGDVGTLANAIALQMGRRLSGDAFYFDGQVRDVIIAYPADIMAANEMGASGEILTLATSPLDTANYCNNEDYWVCTENTGTTITGANEDLTLSNASAWSQEAFISKQLGISEENGGIGGISNIASTWTITKETSIVKFDTRSLKAVNASGDDNDEFTLDSITLGNGEDFWYSFWIYIDAIHASSNLFLDIDGAGNILARQLDTGTDDMGTAYAVDTWLYYEGCFKADQAGTHNLNIRITGAGAGTNSGDIKIDQFIVMPNLVDNGGMEGGADPPANWVQETNATVISDTSEHSGSNELKVTAGAALVGASQAVTLVNAKYYTVSGWARATSGDTARIIIDTGDTTTETVGDVTATTYTKVSHTFKSTGTSGNIYLRGVANTDIVWFDDVAIIQLDQDDPTTTGTTNPRPLDDASSFEDGKWGELLGSLLIDGLDSLTVPSAGNLNDVQGTIAFWMKANGWHGADGVQHNFFDSDADRIILSKRTTNKLHFSPNATDSVLKYISSTSALTSVTFPANTWIHIAITWNQANDNMEIYLNGALHNTTRNSVGAWTLPDYGANLYIGSKNDGTLQADAMIEDFRIYPFEMTLSQIKYLYYLIE